MWSGTKQMPNEQDVTCWGLGLAAKGRTHLMWVPQVQTKATIPFYNLLPNSQNFIPLELKITCNKLTFILGVRVRHKSTSGENVNMAAVVRRKNTVQPWFSRVSVRSFVNVHISLPSKGISTQQGWREAQETTCLATNPGDSGVNWTLLRNISIESHNFKNFISALF